MGEKYTGEMSGVVRGSRSAMSALAAIALAGLSCVAGCSTPGADDGAATGAGSSSSASAAPNGQENHGRNSVAVGTTVRVGGSGDVLIHTPVQEDARRNAGGTGFDFDPMFEGLKGVISAPDISICHMETPLSKDDTDLTVPASMSFNSPHEIADTLKRVGFDGCDHTSNHISDRGLRGIAQTRAVMDAAGLKLQGPPASAPEESIANGSVGSGQAAVMYEAHGVKIANLAYTYTSMNAAEPNTNLPAGIGWMKYWQWPNLGAKGILADAKRAKAAGADVVVLSLHWGTEYHSEPNAVQQKLARELLASPDVDAIFGAHVHVPQPCQQINRKYVVYGMGNFLSNQGASRGLRPQTQDGMFVDLAFTKKSDGGFSQQLTYHPTTVDLTNHHIKLTSPQTAPEAYQRVTQVVNSLDHTCRPAQ